MIQKNKQQLDNFEQFEKEALDEVMTASKNILESFKFSMILNSKVTDNMQEQTNKKLKEYRKEHGLKDIKNYKDYVKDY